MSLNEYVRTRTASQSFESNLFVAHNGLNIAKKTPVVLHFIDYSWKTFHGKIPHLVSHASAENSGNNLHPFLVFPS